MSIRKIVGNRKKIGNNKRNRLGNEAINLKGFLARLLTGSSLPLILFLASLLVYLLVRVIGLEEFPIYFFTDEAAQTILAQDFIRDGFTNYAGEFMPTFFENGGKYNLGFSVYAQIIPLVLFGRSIFTTRMVSVSFSILAAIAVGLSARRFLKHKNWWLSVMVLSMTPAWFLHSRTAFETAIAVSIYALFVYFYLQYRFQKRWWLFPALVCGGLAFYSYASMQPVVLITGLLFLFLDAAYHLKGKWYFAGGGLTLIVLALPYVRYLFNHPDDSAHQLAMLDSYWIGSLSFGEKLVHFSFEYLAGLSPTFWYGNHAGELCRHVMSGYGHLPRVLLPFLITGFIVGLVRLKDPLYRLMLAILLAAPVGASIVQLGITRILVLVIPTTIYTAIGLEYSIAWISNHLPWKRILPIAIFLGLLSGNIWMLVDALKNGPFWFNDYGLDGMQYGARQIFPAVEKFLDKAPERHVILSPSWANGTDVVARFMLSDPIPIVLGSIDGYMNEYHEIPGNTTFIMIPDEYARFKTSDKFTKIQLVQTLDYPDGRPGFYFVNLEYVPGVQDKFRVEREARRMLVVDQVVVNGIPAVVRYSMLDMGVIQQAFDGDMDTPIRTLEANPFTIEMNFQDGFWVDEISLLVGGTTTRASLYLESTDGSHYQSDIFVGEKSHPQDIIFILGNTMELAFMRLEVNSVYDPEPAHVHLWEIKFNEPDA